MFTRTTPKAFVISPATVKTHIRNLYAKLGIHSTRSSSTWSRNKTSSRLLTLTTGLAHLKRANDEKHFMCEYAAFGAVSPVSAAS